MNLEKRLAHVREIYCPVYGAYLVLMGIVFSNQLINMASPLFYGKIVDGLIKAGPISHMYRMAYVMGSLVLVKIVLEFFHGRQHVGKIGYPVESSVSFATLRGVMRLSLGQILNHNSGFKHDIIKKGENALMDMVEVSVFEILPVLLRIAITLIGLFWLNLYLGAVTAGFMLMFALSSTFINMRMAPRVRKLAKKENDLGTYYWEIIKHLRLVVLNHQEERTLEEYRTRQDAIADDGRRLWFSYFTMICCLREPFYALGQFSVLMVSIRLASQGKVTPGALVMAMAWSMNAFQSLGNIGSLQRKLVRYRAHMDRYFELLEIPPAVVEIADPIRLPTVSGRIEFRNVSFEYPRFVSTLNSEEDDAAKPETDEHAATVSDVSFTIEPGTTCALVGCSGSGKSTMVNLLMRGYDPDRGQILVDGHDLRHVHLGDWRGSVGYVEQDPKLWDDTLGYNMSYGRNGQARTVPDDELDTLARQVCIDEFYDRLGSKRFATRIGENGVQLSGGQRQRVAMARAIGKQPEVIIFDEATNALDPLHERIIQDAIRKVLRNRTGIIIAHRLSTIRHAHQIVVMQKGSVVGIGTHEALMGSCRTYRTMVESLSF